MRRSIVALLLIGSLLSVGCLRTTYRHLYGEQGDAEVGFEGQPDRRPARWQHFYLFGWVPGERRIKSGEICGEVGVDEIRTKRSFVQGLLTAITSLLYINIYSPFTAETHCK